MNNVQTREPGAGTIEFAKSYTEGLTRGEALPIIAMLMRDELHDRNDKKIKTCEYCGYIYRDKTKNNSSVVCSLECREARKVIMRTKKRQTDKPKKPTMRDLYYNEDTEYPFWMHEWAMFEDAKRNEVPYSPAKVEAIAAAKHKAIRMGGKRKQNHTASYNGDEGEYMNHKVNVRMAENKEARQAGEITTTQMTPEELREYYESKYSERVRKLERQRSDLYWRGSKF